MDAVNTFIGTKGDGNTFPGASAPFGMTQVVGDRTVEGMVQSQAFCGGSRTRAVPPAQPWLPLAQETVLSGH
ncbi:hypothetical protein [Amycolatopsis sp. NPDC051071]|uniref:hypothetical protein n=1 Tax=Amycolatopsis sp. NPDC051071 TaxID=3154637 RepID=UPI0034169B54